MEYWRNFFLYDDHGFTFSQFSLQHLFAFLIFALIPILLIVFLKEKIQASKFERSLAIFLGSLGLIFEYVQIYWIYNGGVRDWRHMVSTTLCGLALYVSSLAMITNNAFLSRISYFYIHGAFFSFLLPDQEFGFNRFRFYGFFVIHGLIALNSIYLVLVKKHWANRRAMLDSMIFLSPFLLFSIIANNLLNANATQGAFRMNFFYLDYPPFDFPIFSDLYRIRPFLYTLLTFIVYYLLVLICYGLAKLFKIDRDKSISNII